MRSRSARRRPLVAAGHAPDLVIGTSAGSLNAAWLAADPSEVGVASLRRLWLRVKRSQIFPVRPLAAGLGLLGRRDHVVSNAPLTRWLTETLPYRRIEEARIPLTITATDLDTGGPVYLSSGEAIPALVASCAVPGVFPPVTIGGRTLVDGGLSADAPIEVALNGGADRIFVLPTLGPAPPGRPRGAADVLLRSVNLMLGNARDSEIAPWVDRAEIFVVPAPWVPGVSPFSFSHSLALMTEARPGPRRGCPLPARWRPVRRSLPPARCAPRPTPAPDERRFAPTTSDASRRPRGTPRADHEARLAPTTRHADCVPGRLRVVALPAPTIPRIRPARSYAGAATRLALQDPVMRRLVAEAGPPTVRPPAESNFAALVRSILYQQLGRCGGLGDPRSAGGHGGG